jgi:exopolysaccharide biosynthesis polyprenyl glycosylphosphotransferase
MLKETIINFLNTNLKFLQKFSLQIFDSIQQFGIVYIIKKKNLINFILGFIDIFILTVIFQISFNLFEVGDDKLFLFDRNFALLFLYMLPSWLLILQICNVAQIPRTSRKSRLFFQYIQFTALNLIILYLYHLIFNLDTISHSFIIAFSLIGLAVLYSFRIIEYKLFKWFRAQGYNYLNIILIADRTSDSFIEDLIEKKEWGYRILLIFSDSTHLTKKFGQRIKILPEKSVVTLSNLLEIDIVDEVLYLKQDFVPTEVRSVIRTCEEIGVVFRLSSLTSPVYLTNGKLSKIGNTTFLTFVNIPTNSFGIALKATSDIYISFIMLTLLSPLLILIGLCIKLTSSGPVLFRQARVGLRGRQFYLYKFRTMVDNAEELRKHLEEQNEMDGPVFKIKSDPRITTVGKILRKTGLDEIPQLFNVLKGEMSLIGPRPPLQSETRMYKRWQLRRLSVRPGLTCSWQIKPDRNNIKFEKWMKLDLDYIDNWSPRLDLVLLFKTVGTVIRGTGT